MFTKRYQLIADVETANIEPSNTVDPRNSLVYDIGYVIADYSGNVVKSRSFVVADVFLGEKDRMNSAYYANKIPSYITDIIRGDKIVLPFKTIQNIINKDINDYNIEVFNAFNSYFDFTALNTTTQFLTGRTKFFNKYLVVWDIMAMARQVIYCKKSYKDFCKANNLLTATNRISQRAESYYRFITNNSSFEEMHKGLEDVKIETEIYRYCRKQKKKMIRELFKADRK
jgi:hypothetical protein